MPANPPERHGDIPMTSLPERFNFAEHLFHMNRAHAERTAYIDDRGRLS